MNPRRKRTIEELNRDLFLDAVTVLWTGQNVSLWKEQKLMAAMTVNERGWSIAEKIAAWCDKNSYRCPQVHDGKVWL